MKVSRRVEKGRVLILHPINSEYDWTDLLKICLFVGMQTSVSVELLQIVSGSFRDPSWLKKDVSLKLSEEDAEKDEDCWKNLLESKSNIFYFDLTVIYIFSLPTYPNNTTLIKNIVYYMKY